MFTVLYANALLQTLLRRLVLLALVYRLHDLRDPLNEPCNGELWRTNSDVRAGIDGAGGGTGVACSAAPEGAAQLKPASMIAMTTRLLP